MRKTIAIAAIAGLAAVASAQSQGSVELTLTHNADGAAVPGQAVQIDVYADFSGFTSFESMLVALGAVTVDGGASINFDSALAGAGLPIGGGNNEFAFVAEELNGELVLAANTNGGLLAFPLGSNPQDVHLFSFTVIAGDEPGFNVFFGPADGVGFTMFDLATNLTTEFDLSGSVFVPVVPTPGVASLAGLAGLAALRRRR